MIERLKQRHKLLGLLLLLCVSGCESQQTEAPSPFPILDSGVTASTNSGDNLYWMDNNRVIFVSYGPKPKKVDENQRRMPGIYIWDTSDNSVNKYADGSAICYHDGYIRYAFYGKDAPTLDPDKEKGSYWKEGPIGKETIKVAAFSTVEEYRAWYRANPLNRYTCRIVKRPSTMEGKVWIPLTEPHGELEWETDTLPDVSDQEQPIVLRRASDNKAIPLDIKRGDIGLSTPYYYIAYRDAYFFQEPVDIERIKNTSCVRYWWMSINGTIESGCQSIVQLKNVTDSGVSLYPTPIGILISAGKLNDTDAGTAGYYVIEKDKVQRVIKGGHGVPALSSDGCKLAIRHTPFYLAKRVGSPGETRLKMVNLCANGGNANE